MFIMSPASALNLDPSTILLFDEKLKPALGGFF